MYIYIYIYTINGLIHFPHTSNLRMSTFQNLNAQRYEPPSQTQRGQLPGLEETVSVLVKWFDNWYHMSRPGFLKWFDSTKKIDAHLAIMLRGLPLWIWAFRCHMFNHWRDVQIDPTTNPMHYRNLWNVQRVKEHPEKVLVANPWLVPSQLAVRRHGAQDSGGEVFCRGACHSRVVSDLAIGRNYLHCT